MNEQPMFEFRVWDKPNKMFLVEFQTEHGQWVWGRGNHLTGKSTWKWILDHPEDFVICIYVGVIETGNEKRKIFTSDIISCWNHAADEGAGKRHNGIIEFVAGGFELNTNNVYLRHWTNAENIEILGNIFEKKIRTSRCCHW